MAFVLLDFGAGGFTTVSGTWILVFNPASVRSLGIDLIGNRVLHIAQMGFGSQKTIRVVGVRLAFALRETEEREGKRREGTYWRDRHYIRNPRPTFYDDKNTLHGS